MFYVINKSKIYSYLIALCTVVILFVAATTINDAVSPSVNLIETGANVIYQNDVSQNKMKENQIENNKNNSIQGQKTINQENYLIQNDKM